MKHQRTLVTKEEMKRNGKREWIQLISRWPNYNSGKQIEEKEEENKLTIPGNLKT